MIKLIQSFGTLALLAVPSISTETSIDVRLALGPGVYLRPWVAGEKEIIQGSSLKELHPDVDWLSSTPGAYLEYRLYYANSPYAPKEGSVDTRDFESRFDYVECHLTTVEGATPGDATFVYQAVEPHAPVSEMGGFKFECMPETP